MVDHSPLVLTGQILLVAGLATCVLLAFRSSRRSRLPYPPGPSPLPFLGNIKQIPQGKQALGYRYLAEEYGKLPLPFGGTTCLPSTVRGYLPPFHPRKPHYRP